ncbi:hypothetical protein OB920_06500 [Halobacteria archaeon HArc-gm2]|nr:hypothetical protein [Halobacteria archaeon HArc-gm2]
MTDDADDLAALHDHLAATAELPVERSASRWLGEAEALAADLRESDLPDDVVADRLATIEELLSAVDETGDERADEHVAAARERLADARSRFD